MADIKEPTRKSLLDVLKYNLSKAERVTFLHRLIYIGRHTFTDEKPTVLEHFERNIKEVNSGYCDEKLSGIFLYYPTYFCHIIDGSEDTLNKHLRLLLIHENSKEHIGVIKLLVAYHHINQRFRQDWIGITGKPPTLWEKIDKNIDMEKTSVKIKICLVKLYKLGIITRPKPKPVKEVVDDDEEEEEEEEEEIALKVTPDCLPEYALLDFLLDSLYTRNIIEYYGKYNVIPLIPEPKDLVWPIPTDFTPVHIFDEVKDPIKDISLKDTVE